MTEEITHLEINAMPKVELHLHLEGAFTFEFLFGLITKYGGDSEIRNIENLRSKFDFKDFSHFIETWFWKNNFFRSPVDFEESTYSTVENLFKQNVIYAEVFFSPWDFASADLPMESIVEATLSGIKKAQKAYPINIGLIADIVRDHGAETAMKRLDQVTPYLGKGVIGIGLGGNESAFPAMPYKEVFLEAKKRGFRTTVHAGEGAGPESVWAAVLDLGAERIGHGVRAVEDPRLVDYINKQRIPLEICITSNLCTKLFSSVIDHPFDRLYKRGLLVTVNSDDPPMFGANITDEFILLKDKLKYTRKDMLALTKNAVESSFLDETGRKIIRTDVENYFKSA